MSAAVSVHMEGLEQTIAMLKARSRALTDLTPVYKAMGAEMVKKTDDAFQDSRGYDGEAWDALAQSTIDKRVGSLKAANKKTKAGKLTKGAMRFRERLKSPGGIKPLIDTARARNSNHATTSREGIEWSAVGYLGVHMAGTDRAGKNHNIVIPMRNPSPFIWVNDEWVLRESARKSLEEKIKAHVFGKGGGVL